MFYDFMIDNVFIVCGCCEMLSNDIKFRFFVYIKLLMNRVRLYKNVTRETYHSIRRVHSTYYRPSPISTMFCSNVHVKAYFLYLLDHTLMYGTINREYKFAYILQLIPLKILKKNVLQASRKKVVYSDTKQTFCQL